MNTYQVATLYREICDEPDDTFLTDAKVAGALQRAYDQFRSKVHDKVPYLYSTTIDITVPAPVGANPFRVYDLTQAAANPTAAGSPSIAGPEPNNAGTTIPRLVKLLSVEAITALSGAPSFRLVSARGQDSFWNGRSQYIMRGQELWFRVNIGFARLHFVAEQSIGLSPTSFFPSWSAAVLPASPEYIDDLNEWHDLIALMAYDEYAIMDGAPNPLVLALRKRRIEELDAYLQQRAYDGVRYVQNVVRPGELE